MAEQQINFALDTSFAPAPAAPPDLRDEIAQAWGLPIGERVEISFRRGQLDAITGMLELLSTPDYPWNPRQPLQLRIAGFTFTSRDIERWTRV